MNNNQCKIKSCLNDHMIAPISDIVLEHCDEPIRGKHIESFFSCHNKEKKPYKPKSKLMYGSFIRFCLVDDYLHKISKNNSEYVLSLFRVMLDSPDNKIDIDCEKYDRSIYGRQKYEELRKAENKEVEQKEYSDAENGDHTKGKCNKCGKQNCEEHALNCVRVNDKMYIKYIHEHKLVFPDNVTLINKIVVSKLRNETYLLSDHNVYVFDTFTGTYLRQFTLLLEKSKKIKQLRQANNNDLQFLAYYENYGSMVLSHDETEMIISDEINHRVLVLSIDPNIGTQGALLHEILLNSNEEPKGIALYKNQIFLACIDNTNEYNQYVLVFDKTTTNVIRKIKINTLFNSSITLAIFGEYIYLPHDDGGIDITFSAFNINKNFKTKNFSEEDCDDDLVFFNIDDNSTDDEYQQNYKSHFHQWNICHIDHNADLNMGECGYDEYNGNMFSSNDGIIGVCHGKAFLLSRTYCNTILHIVE